MHPMPSADPAYDTDTPLAYLSTAELLLLTTTRLWMAHFFDPDAGHRPWRSGFAAANLEPCAAQAFDEFWRVVGGDGPCNRERLAMRVKAWDDGAWVREAALAHARKQSIQEAA